MDLLVPDFDNFSILIPQVDKLAGLLQAKFDIKGKIDKPSITGQAFIADALVKSSMVPTQINDLNAKIDIENNKAKIDVIFYQ